MQWSSGVANPVLKPQLPPGRGAGLEANPRPWPPRPEEQPRSSALAALNQQSQEVLLPGVVRWAAAEARDDWRARPTPQGWTIPRNPAGEPLQPYDPFQIPEGTEDLGSLRVVPSCSGRIRAFRLQWPEEFLDPAFAAQQAVLRDLLENFSDDVSLHIVAEGRGSAAVPPHPRLHVYALNLRSGPDRVYEPMTMWARDAAVLLLAEQGRVLALPRHFRGHGKVDPKLNRLVLQGTAAAPASLAAHLPDLMVRRTELCFEGGDIVASSRLALVGADSVLRTVRDTGKTREQVVRAFEQLLGVEVLVLQPQPDFHVDLGFTWLDEHTVAVADPAWGVQLAGSRGELREAVETTLARELAPKYETCCALLASNGLRVVRLPALAGRGLLTPYYTYNNVLMECYPGVKRVLLPTYGVEALDEAAREVYRGHGFQVHDMPSARHSTKLWGAIRCATGELDWSPT